jgi:hypothetical protein
MLKKTVLLAVRAKSEEMFVGVVKEETRQAMYV